MELDFSNDDWQNSFAESENEQIALTFCRDWINNNNFHIKSSGSTAEAKSIVLSKEQMTKSAFRTAEFLNLEEGSRFFLCLSAARIAGIMMLVRAIVLKGKIKITEASSNPLEWLLPDETFNIVSLVPMQLKSIIQKYGVQKLEAFENILVGGAALDSDLEDQLKKKIKSNVFETYGMTETASNIALRKIDADSGDKYFKAFPGIKLSLDERSCLVIEDDQKIITNDLAELISENEFRIHGRIDNVINSGGVKIVPEKIEEILTVHLKEFYGSVPEFFLAGFPDSILGEKLVLIIESAENPDLKEYLKKRIRGLEKYEFPRNILFLSPLRRTESGKLDRKNIIKEIAKSPGIYGV